MRSKLFAIMSIVLVVFLLSGCQLSQMFGSVKDMTSSAKVLIDELERTIRDVNDKAEAGVLEDDIADLTEEVLARALDQISIMLEENGGVLFGPANGMIDNIFNNMSNQLDQIKEGYLDESFPQLIDQVSTEMNNSMLRLSSEVQDIITLAAGNTFVAVDKATNFMVTVLSIVLLAIGLLIMTITLLKAREKLNKTRMIGLGFGCIYTLFFLAILLVAPLRGYVIAGFDFGVEVKAQALEPKITAISPKDFTLGEDDTITIYGNHLNLIEDLSVRLVQGSGFQRAFQDAKIAVATRYSIILCDLNKGPDGWIAPNYDNFFEKISQPVLGAFDDAASPDEDSEGPIDPVANFFYEHFGINQGEYGLVVYTGEERIESPQHIRLTNPTPPAPQPDLIPLELSWSSEAVIDELSSLTVKLKVVRATEVTKTFKIKVIEISSGRNWEVIVDLATIGKAITDETCEVNIPGIRPSKLGNQDYKVIVDSGSSISEEYENNNELQRTLKVSQYVYDAQVRIATFDPFKNYDDTDNEFRVTVTVGLSGEEKQVKKIHENGRASKSYPVNWVIDYPDIQEGDVISFYTSGYEADAGTFYDSHDDMGKDSETVVIENDTTRGKDYVSRPITLTASGYKINGNITFTRRIK